MEVTDYQVWKIGFDLVQTLFIVMMWFFYKNNAVHDRVDQNERDLTEIKTQLKSMPEFKNMEDIRKDVHQVDNKLSKMDGLLDGIIAKVNMIDQHLISKEGK